MKTADRPGAEKSQKSSLTPNDPGGDGDLHRAPTETAALRRERELWYHKVLDALPAAVYTTDAAGRITYYNRAAVALAGRRPELGKGEWCIGGRLYRPDGTPMPHDQCPMAVALRENRPIRGEEAILERPDGTRIAFLPYPTPLRDASGTLIGALNLLVDITDRKAAESARAYLAALVDSSDDAIVSKNLDGIVTSWNRGAETVFGYPAEEMIGRPIAVLIPPDRLHEEDMILARLRRGQKIDHFETVRRRKDGREIDVSLTISPVLDTAGRIIGASKIARDITERKRAEAALRDLNENLERRVAERTRELAEAIERERAQAKEREQTEAALQQAQKMEVVGQLAAGVAHDFNNLLTSVLGNLELLSMGLADERLQKLAQAATRAAQRGVKLNEQMLAFSRKQHLTPASIDLNALVRGIEDMLRRTLGGTIAVTTALAPDLWPALVDPHQLELVILNLAINARDAMPFGGRIRIETRNVKASALDKSVALAPGDYVRISIADTGEGMSEDVLARACEPFYTTKGPGKGSGLGLAQVYGVAQQSGGGMRIRSAVGRGTTVEVYLPRSFARAEAATEWRDGKQSQAPGSRATVLVVEDQEDVREVIAAQLEVLGYQTVQASSGRAALDLLGGNCAGVDALIADYAMPGMSGIELAEAVRVTCPDLPVIIATGYADTTGFGERIEDAVLLKKPYRMNELGAAVEYALRHQNRHGRPSRVDPLRPAERPRAPENYKI
ncbi:MAG TPA: PAS domain S-box protein [Stellaceae bacterium]|nr:PAS domain S-box protein [Stellaceae bacterium]